MSLEQRAQNVQLVVEAVKLVLPVFRIPVLGDALGFVADFVVVRSFARAALKGLVEKLNAEGARISAGIVWRNGASVAGLVPVGTTIDPPYKLEDFPGKPDAPFLLRLRLPPEPWKFVAHPCDPDVKKGIVRTYPGGRCYNEAEFKKAVA